MATTSRTRIVFMVSLCSLVALATGYDIDPPSPVPPTTPGIIYNAAPSPPQVRLEVFIEVHCPDSRDAWPILKNLSSHYGPDRLEILVQQLPLPYHRNAFLGTQGLYVIQEQVPDKIFDYIEANLANWATFSTANTVNLSETQVLDILADLAVSSTGIDKALFTSRIGAFRSYTATIWKFGVRRAVSAVPTFFVNGVELGIGNNKPTFEDWTAFLDWYINQ